MESAETRAGDGVLKPGVQRSRHGPSRPRVLLVEDDPDGSRLFRELLDDVGAPFTVTHADSLQGALAHLGGHAADAVVTDLRLPDSVGSQTFSAIQRAAPDAAILVLTGAADDTMGRALLQVGAQDYLVKGGTLDGQLLSRAISDAIERKRITNALLESEGRFKTVWESIQTGLVLIEPESHQIVDANPMALRMMRVARSDLVGRLCSNFMCNATPDKCPVTQLGQVVTNRECEVVDAEGRRHLVLQTVSSISFSGGDLLLESLVDITDLKQAEREKEQLEAHMRQQQKLESIGVLAGGVAHEINNPINGVMNYAQLIADGLESGSPLAEHAAEIVHETERVATIVRSLLAFARQDKRSHSPARVCDIVDATLSLIRTVVRRDQITLDVDVPSELPFVRCRSQQIQQVLMNLMTNARDALNERFPTHNADKIMRVSARAFREDNRAWIRITVEDRGSGIPPDVRERIFDPFFTTKPKETGTGLGLSISHGIVREHGGTLAVESEAGRYTRFHVDLPLHCVENAAPPDAGEPTGGG